MDREKDRMWSILALKAWRPPFLTLKVSLKAHLTAWRFTWALGLTAVVRCVILLSSIAQSKLLQYISYLLSSRYHWCFFFLFRGNQDWTLVSNSVKPSGNFVVLDLSPASWYNLRVTAHNRAGSTVAEYEFATLTLAGGTLFYQIAVNICSWARLHNLLVWIWYDL